MLSSQLGCFCCLASSSLDRLKVKTRSSWPLVIFITFAISDGSRYLCRQQSRPQHEPEQEHAEQETRDAPPHEKATPSHPQSLVLAVKVQRPVQVAKILC